MRPLPPIDSSALDEQERVRAMASLWCCCFNPFDRSSVSDDHSELHFGKASPAIKVPCGHHSVSGKEGSNAASDTVKSSNSQISTGKFSAGDLLSG